MRARRIAAQTQAMPAVPEAKPPMRSVNGSSLGAELIARLVRLDVRIAVQGGFSKGCSDA